MGYNTGLLLVENAAPEDVQSAIDVMVFAKRVVKFEEATGKYAVGAINEWAAFWDQDVHRTAGHTKIGRELVRTLAAHGRMLALSMASVESTYAFTWYVKKKIRRAVTFRNGKIVAEEGETLAEERGISVPSWGADELFLFTLMERLTGIGFDALERGRYRVLKQDRL